MHHRQAMVCFSGCSLKAQKAYYASLVPFLACDNDTLVIAEWQPIVAWAKLQQQQNRSSGGAPTLPVELTDSQRATIAAWSSTIESTLRRAELLATFAFADNYSQYAAPRLGAPFNFPLSWLIPKRWRLRAQEELTAGVDDSYSYDKIFSDVSKLVSAAIKQIEASGSGWFLAEPSEIDCLLYGHLTAIMYDELPSDDLRRTVFEDGEKNLLNTYCKRIEQTFRQYSFTEQTPQIAVTTERLATEHIVETLPSIRISD